MKIQKRKSMNIIISIGMKYFFFKQMKFLKCILYSLETEKIALWVMLFLTII